MYIVQISVSQMSVNQMSVSQMTVSRMPVSQMPVSQKHTKSLKYIFIFLFFIFLIFIINGERLESIHNDIYIFIFFSENMTLKVFSSVLIVANDNDRIKTIPILVQNIQNLNEEFVKTRLVFTKVIKNCNNL
jgi:hypothetical protein